MEQILSRYWRSAKIPADRRGHPRYFVKQSDALVPPKPNELLSATSTLDVVNMSTKTLPFRKGTREEEEMT